MFCIILFIIFNPIIVFVVDSKLDIKNAYELANESYYRERIVLKSEFTNEFKINFSYADINIDVSGHSLVNDVKHCVVLMESFAPHCVKSVRNKWPKADHNMQRIPQFYFNAIKDNNFTYFYDFGANGKPLFESYKCCIIYEILDCIHTEYKQNCVGLSFGPVDEVIHLFTMEVQDNCEGYHIDNKLFNAISKSRYHNKPKTDEKDCVKQFLKSSDCNSFDIRSNVQLFCLAFSLYYSLLM